MASFDNSAFDPSAFDAGAFDLDAGTADVKVSWLAFDTSATPVDVRVSWLAFDTAATPCDVRVSWVCLDTAVEPDVAPEVPQGGTGGGAGIVSNGPIDTLPAHFKGEAQDWEAFYRGLKELAAIPAVPAIPPGSARNAGSVDKDAGLAPIEPTRCIAQDSRCIAQGSLPEGVPLSPDLGEYTTTHQASNQALAPVDIAYPAMKAIATARANDEALAMILILMEATA